MAAFSDQVPFDPSTATPTVVDGTASLDDNFDPALPTTVSGTGETIYDNEPGVRFEPHGDEHRRADDDRHAYGRPPIRPRS